MTFPAHLLSFITSQQYQTNTFNTFNTTPSGGVGTTSFTVPAGVTMMSAVCVGGGGGGSGSPGGADDFGSGAGGGGGVRWSVFSVEPGDILDIQVGYGGSGGPNSAAAAGNGNNGTTSAITLQRRNGIIVDELIMQAVGGSGGQRATTAAGTGVAGAGGGGSVNTANPYVTHYLTGGGTGGSGGASNNIGCGGGGAAGYSGNGGTGGNATTQPSSAATDSGGGGGGGNGDPLGYGGGGTGAFGFSGTGQGSAGVNGSAGGGGGSYFNDPGLGLVALKVGEEVSVSGPGITTIAVPTGTIAGDFLLLLSGSDADSGLTAMPVPVGFTTFNKSSGGVYYTSKENYTIGGGIGTEAIARNVDAEYQQLDLNFANSFKYVDDLSTDFSLINGQYCVTGLTTYPAIHNLISLRYIPGSNTNPASIRWEADSGDPSINTDQVTSMPQPPQITGVAPGSLSITLGYLANTILNPSNQVAPIGYNLIGVSANPNDPPETSSIMAAYRHNNGAGISTNPGAFLTGTASHSRAYTIQINRTNSGTPITYVGFSTATTPTTTLSLSGLGLTNGDLVIVATVSDNPNGGSAPGAPSLAGNGMTVLNSGSEPDNRQTTGNTPGMAYGVWYGIYNGGTQSITGLYNGATASPSSHIAMVFRGATMTTNYAVFDSNTNRRVQAPDPPNLNTLSGTASANNTIVIIGMTDDVKIANVTVDNIDAPTGYTLLAAQSYGEQNNGVIIMSAIKFGLISAVETPSSFVGDASNIWSSQTIIVGGPGSDTGGVQGAGGQYGGGGGSRDEDSNGSGGNGAGGAVRLIWGTARQYPSANQGNSPLIDWTP